MANLGYVPTLGQIGYVPVFSGEGDWMETIDWENNKWTYIAGGGALALILMGLVVKKKRKRRKKMSSPVARSAGGPRSLSVNYQG